jgi:methylmalonyl-CoA/ethylmalonyl-CoA epimerase
MEILKINHIGIAVKSLDYSIPIFEKLFASNCYQVEEVESQSVKIAFLKVGDIKIELLESIEDDGPISKFIKAKGEGLHHIALEVSNVEEAVEVCKNYGFRTIGTEISIGAGGLRIIFLNPRKTNNILIELCSIV